MEPIWPKAFLPNAMRAAFRLKTGGQLSTYVLALEGWRRGLDVTFLDSKLNRFTISDGKTSVMFNHSCPVSLTPVSARAIARDKHRTKLALSGAGVPVPRGSLVRSDISESELKSIADEIGYPITIKPLDGSRGHGVFTNIQDRDELVTTFKHLVSTSDSVEIMVEHHYEGNDYRILVLGDQVLAVCHRVPASVLGDGQNTVGDLIAAKNETRRKNPFLSKGLIKVDFEIEGMLEEQGLQLSSVPAEGQRVWLRRIANASAGGDVVDCTEEMPVEIKQAAINAVRAVPGLVIAGVDVLYEGEDAVSARDFTTIEINYRPHIAVNMYPTEGVGQDAPRKMLDYFFPGSPRRSSRTFDNAVFDLDTLLAPLVAGVASEVTVREPPVSGYRARKLLEFGANAFSAMDRRNIVSLAQKNQVSGFLQVKNNLIQIVCCGRGSDVEKVIEAARRKASSEILRETNWVGRIVQGFRVLDNTSSL